MTRKEEKAATKKKILAACVRLFLEQGYYKTTMSQIIKEAGVSSSSFQNIFGTKDGVLLDLTKFMFDSQFEAAKSIDGSNLSPVIVYAAEIAIQMTLTELNENIREIYVEAYSNPESSEYIYRNTSAELKEIFSDYNPSCTSVDFYETDIGTSGMMRAYMSRKCDIYFTLEKKLERFLTLSLKAYNVPESEISEAVGYILKMNIREISAKILNKLFHTLAMKFDFEIDEIR